MLYQTGFVIFKSSLVMKNLPKGIPEQGFIKITGLKPVDMTPAERVKLVRRGNEFYNNGNLVMARKVFLATGYSDGIIRIADDDYSKGDILKSLTMYKAAHAQTKIDEIVKKMAIVVQEWLNEK